MKKIIKYILVFWVLINLGLFVGSGNFLLKKDNNVFFPFGETIHYVYTVKNAVDIKDYDYTEFIVYAIIIPALVLILLFRKETINFFNNRIDQFNKKNPTNVSDNLSGAENGQMHKQRLLILVVNLLALICVFLPWVSASLGKVSISISGIHEKWDGFGIAIIVMAFLIIILSLLGERTTILKGVPRIIVIILNVLILIDIFLIVAATKSQGGTFVENSTGWFWLIPILSIASIVLSLFYKSVNRLEIKTNS